MARNSGGSHSLPSGNPVVSGTTISATTQNNTLSDISAEITDSLCRSGKGAMLAPLELVDGAVGTPALTFDNDTDTGIYRKGANNMALVAGGAEILDVQAAGVDITGALAVSGAVAGAAVSGTTGTFSGAVAGTTGTFSGAVAGTTGTFSGAVAGTTGTFSGNVSLTGSNPASTTGFTNTVTPASPAKAWATFTGSGTAATQTVSGGFNITSIVLANAGGTGRFTVTFATAMGNANYAVVYGDSATGGKCSTVSKAAGNFVFQLNDTTSGSGLGVAFNIFMLDFVVFGTQ